MSEILEAHIQDLNISLWNSKVRVEQELLRKERGLVASQVTPEMWEEKFQEEEHAQDWTRHWKDRFDSLQRESLDFLNEREEMNENFGNYEGTICFLHVEGDEYHEKLPVWRRSVTS